MPRILLVMVIAGMLTAGRSAADPPGELNFKTLPDWCEVIRPKTDDVCFKTVNWLPTFWDGVMTAQTEDKPILLWAMNGHPLACT
jgi:hypothetical protein